MSSSTGDARASCHVAESFGAPLLEPSESSSPHRECRRGCLRGTASAAPCVGMVDVRAAKGPQSSPLEAVCSGACGPDLCTSVFSANENGLS